MPDSSLTVFFDGGCPLCSREISHYRKLQTLKTIAWIDITQAPESLSEHGIPLSDAMAEFHVVDTSGQLHKGVDGFLLLWEALPYYRHLSCLCRHLPILSLMKQGYSRFARWHFMKRCPEGYCSSKNQ